jgi:hypothetical protein
MPNRFKAGNEKKLGWVFLNFYTIAQFRISCRLARCYFCRRHTFITFFNSSLMLSKNKLVRLSVLQIFCCRLWEILTFLKQSFVSSKWQSYKLFICGQCCRQNKLVCLSAVHIFCCRLVNITQTKLYLYQKAILWT